MTIKFYDTRNKRLTEFQPLTPGLVKMYTCGPTVYADAHIGNFRTYVFEDVLRRTLKYFGFQVTQVMNLTDVEDKTIRESRAAGIPLNQHTAPFIAGFFDDLDTLGIERAEVYPAATQHIGEMIALIQSLIDKGYAYLADGNVYYSVEKFSRYGELSGKKLTHLRRGVRIDADEYDEKEDFRDFALWKGWSVEDGDVWWDSPWGKGRPGWHIECSAMSMKYLGPDFDIHTGGVDNIFPHHENEIAQSVAGTGCGFARYWLHSAHLIVNGEKMSKSLGNYFTLKQLVAKGLSPRTIRYVLLTVHYRQQLNFSDDAVSAANSSLERLDTLRTAFDEAKGEGTVRPELTAAIEESRLKFRESLADDLNISGAMAALFGLVSSVHRIAQAQPLNGSEGEAGMNYWKSVDRVLALLIPKQAKLPLQIELLVKQRLAARRAKQWATSDQIRDQVTSLGYQLEDGAQGTLVIWGEGRTIVSNN